MMLVKETRFIPGNDQARLFTYGTDAASLKSNISLDMLNEFTAVSSPNADSKPK